MMIEARHVVKRFGLKPVLRGVDFLVERGEFVALVGANGAGKTTLLRILASLARPNAGRVQVAGFVLPAQAAAVRRSIGVLSHQPLLYGDLTAEENLRFYGKIYAVHHLDNRIDDTLKLVGLQHRRRDLVRNFSRGMQQRLAIARATLHEPELLLFDEPHTGLDPDAAAMLDGLLREVAQHGRTIVMTSHDLERASDLATRVDILSKGKIAASFHHGEIESQRLLEMYRSVSRG
jgi:heme exporter protein A